MRAVLLIALVALFAVSQASGYVWTQAYYQNNAPTFLCNSTALPVVQATNYTNGVCQNTTGYSFQYYCINSGANVLTYTYSDVNCVTANLLAVTSTPTVCGAGSSSSKFQCTGADTMTFPPAGYSLSTMTYNNTFNPSSPNGVGGAGESTGSCVANPPNAVAVQTASPMKCVKRVTGTNDTPYSTQSYCKANAGWSATFLSADCTGTLYKLSQTTNPGCKNGAVSTCTDSGSIPSAPTNLFGTVASATKFSGALCGVTANFYSQDWYGPDCVDSQTIQCTSNSSVAGVVNAGGNIRLTSYVPAAAGACSGALAAGTASNPNPTYKNVTGQCDQSGSGYVQSYSCSGGSPNGPNGNSASSASVSIVALVIAAFIALISQ